MVFKNQRLSGEHHFVELKFNPQNMWFYWFSGSNACSSCESGKKTKLLSLDLGMQLRASHGF